VLWATILVGDALERLRELPDGSAQCCVTSPPYYGLRDYGTASWEGGDDGCDHAAPNDAPNGNKGQPPTHAGRFAGDCRRCGARRVDRQIGLEETPDAYVARLVDVFREVRRVLRPDGTLWLNVGDSYCGMGGHTCLGETSQRKGRANVAAQNERKGIPPSNGVKAKDLLGIPWLVAFALRADGWYLRSEIIWHKPAPMPESVRDRPTKAHEQVFLLSKRSRYFYDAEAIKEDYADARRGNPGTLPARPEKATGPNDRNGHSQWERGREYRDLGGANVRSVWTIGPTPFSGAHFATMPEGLAERCILAGTSAKGACQACGAPWVRVVDRERKPTRPGVQSKVYAAPPVHPDSPMMRHNGDVCGNRDPQRHCTVASTTGWQPSCRCPDAPPVPCVVLDPFGGAATTALVAARHGRDSVSIELNPDYADMGAGRVREEMGLVCHVEVVR